MIDLNIEPGTEPLALSAALAWKIAPQRCRQENGGNCAWSHGFWQILRIMELAGSAANRGALYRRVFDLTSMETPLPRILVSGTADYAMLAQIVQASRHGKVSPQVTVVDICDTPLYLNRWYAGKIGIDIETRCCDILDFGHPEGFDMICTDAFFGRLHPGLWPALVNRWHSLLKPGGRLVTACRLRPGSGPEREGFSERQAGALLESVRCEAKRIGALLSLESAALESAAAEYAARHLTYPVRSTGEIGRLLDAAGFVVEELTFAAHTEPAAGKVSDGPSFRSAGNYLHVVARRP